MSSTPESKVKDRIVKILKKHGVYYFFPATHGYGRSGVPDIICCYRGQFVAIECKAGNNKPTALQLRELKNITVSGGHAFALGGHHCDRRGGTGLGHHRCGSDADRATRVRGAGKGPP